MFAAWPEEWDAEFTLAARGAFLVTSTRRNGHIDFIEIKSQVGGVCRVMNPWGHDDIRFFRNGKPEEESGGHLLKFNTAKDEIVLILKRGVDPSMLRRTVAV